MPNRQKQCESYEYQRIAEVLSLHSLTFVALDEQIARTEGELIAAENRVRVAWTALEEMLDLQAAVPATIACMPDTLEMARERHESEIDLLRALEAQYEDMVRVRTEMDTLDLP